MPERKSGGTIMTRAISRPDVAPKAWIIRTVVAIVFIGYTLTFNAAEMMGLIEHVHVIDGEKIAPGWEHYLAKWGPGFIGTLAIMPDVMHGMLDFIRTFRKAWRGG